MKQEVFSDDTPQLLKPLSTTEENMRAWLEAYELWYGDDIPEMLPETIQTMALAYRQICAGDHPWRALGHFTNAWYGYAKRRRESLISEPLPNPENLTKYTYRWRAFCAASVEFLCERYGLSIPEWAHDPRYILANPWRYFIIAKSPSVREYMICTTPEPFKRRNIYCGNRLFQNKYELAAWSMEALAKGITDPVERGDYIREKEASIHGG